jgi:hypothetical protein
MMVKASLYHGLMLIISYCTKMENYDTSTEKLMHSSKSSLKSLGIFKPRNNLLYSRHRPSQGSLLTEVQRIQLIFFQTYSILYVDSLTRTNHSNLANILTSVLSINAIIRLLIQRLA